MRLASFVDPKLGREARFGIVRGESIVDVVPVANALHLAVPATTVKAALTSGAHTIAALEELATAAERAKLVRPIAGLKFLPPIPDPSKFFCVGKNNKKHREELAANKMLTEVPNEPTGFIKLTSTISGDGDEVVKPAGITTLDYEPELCYVVGKRAHGVKKAEAMAYISGFTLTNDVSAREIQQREVASGLRRQRQAAAARQHRRLSLQDRRRAGAFFALCRVRARRPHCHGGAERRRGRAAQCGRTLSAGR